MDVQVDQQSELDRVQREKIRKYPDNPDIKQDITRTTGSTNILHLPSSIGEEHGAKINRFS